MKVKKISVLIICACLLIGCGESSETGEISEDIIELVNSGNVSLPTEEEIQTRGPENSQAEFLQKQLENKPEDIKKIIKGIDINGNVDIPGIAALVSDVKDNNDGTYTVTFTNCKRYVLQEVDLNTYDSLSLGCKLPFETYLSGNYICYDDSDGYFFSENGMDPEGEGESIWIKKDSDSNDVNVYYSAPYAFNGYADYHNIVELDDFTYPIRGDLYIQIRSGENCAINSYTFKEFFNSNDTSTQGYTGTWKNLYIVHINFNPGDGQINQFIENLLAG